MSGPAFDVTDDRLARVAWSVLTEPGDVAAGRLVEALGAGAALRWVYAAVGSGNVPRLVDGLVHEAPALVEARRILVHAVDRWAPRLASLEPARDLERLRHVGGVVLVPGAPGWPAGLTSLGRGAPMCLWVRGNPDVSGIVSRSVSVVGSRASTPYGERIAVDLAAGLVARRACVVSGGAYGIDAAAHRGALTAGGSTVVLLAGGVDRSYPVGNAPLIERAIESGGSVLSEVPPGAVPSRSRFLMRNRLIAAVSRATVVVEASWRSGALSTAHHAAALLRPLGAVPGPVTSMASAGCHRLLRDGSAICVTDADEVMELAGQVGADLAPAAPDVDRAEDRLDWVAQRVLEALPMRSPADPDRLARLAGLSGAEVRGALGTLEIAGFAQASPAGWRRAPTRRR